MSAHNPRTAAVLALAAAALLGGCGGDDEDASEPPDVAVTATQPAATTATAPPARTATTTTTATTATATTPKRSLADARRAVDQDNYAEAVGIAAAAGTAEASTIRRRISNRIARRIMSALRAGDRSRAAFLVNSARSYPPTRPLRDALREYQRARAGAG